MAYNTKEIITDVHGNPISQYYNPITDGYEEVEGLKGANKTILYNPDGSERESVSLLPILDKLSQLTGTVIDENTRKHNELQRVALYNNVLDLLNTGQLKGEQGVAGSGLEFNWEGYSLGVRIKGQTQYAYINLRGEQGIQGPAGDLSNLTKLSVTTALGYTPPEQDTVTTINGKTGAIAKSDIVALGIPSADTNTITTINGKTGAIAKADIVALGIPSADTNTTYTAGTGLTLTGTVFTPTFGTIAGTITQGNDSRLSNSRTPLAHSHTIGDLPAYPTTLPANGGNASTVGGFTVGISVPANAKFTDTVYTHPAGTNPHGTTKSDVGLGNITNDKQMPISGGVLENYREKLTTLSGTTTAINLSLGNVFTHSLTGNTTYSISNAVSGQAHSFTLIINQTATARTITFPASVKWQGGEIPDLSGASKTYILTFLTVDGGTTWYGNGSDY